MLAAEYIRGRVVAAAVLALSWMSAGSAQGIEMDTLTIEGPQGSLAAFHSPGSQDGLAIVFLHGDSSRALQWEHVWRGLSVTHELIALDFRGHGASDPARDNNYSYAARGSDVIAVADALDADRLLLVAHSGAAGAAFEVGALEPDRVIGIFLLDPPNDPRSLSQEVRQGFVEALAGPDSFEVQSQYFSSIAGKDAAIVERVLEDAAAVDPAARHGVGKAIADWNPQAALSAYMGPIEMMTSEAMNQPASLSSIRPKIPNQVVAGTGHWIQLEHPNLVISALQEFIQEIEQAESQ